MIPLTEAQARISGWRRKGGLVLTQTIAGQSQLERE